MQSECIPQKPVLIVKTPTWPSALTMQSRICILIKHHAFPYESKGPNNQILGFKIVACGLIFGYQVSINLKPKPRPWNPKLGALGISCLELQISHRVYESLNPKTNIECISPIYKPNKTRQNPVKPYERPTKVLMNPARPARSLQNPLRFRFEGSTWHSAAAIRSSKIMKSVLG